MRPTIEQLRGAGDFASPFRWNLLFTRLPILPGFATTDLLSLNIRCESTDQPKRTNQKITVNMRGHQVHQPGITNYNGTMTLTFNETVDSKIALFLKAWGDACWAPKNGIRPPKSLVEGQILLTRLNNQDLPIWKTTIKGVFLEDYDMGQLDGSTSDTIKPSMTISYDYFEDSIF